MSHFLFTGGCQLARNEIPVEFLRGTVSLWAVLCCLFQVQHRLRPGGAAEECHEGVDGNLEGLAE